MILGPHILHSSKSNGSSELKNKFYVIPVETFCNIDAKLTFDLILAPFDMKKGPKIRPLSAHILHTSKRSSNELKDKFYVNPVATFCNIYEILTFYVILSLLSLFGGQKGHENMAPHGP